jgi:hypothetical protein
MSAGGWLLLAAIVVSLAALLFVVFSMVRTIQDERRAGRPVWKDFGLGISLMILFFVTWIAHGVAQWQTFTDEQRSHGESAQLGDFMGEFSQATLENWQSEFLQLFAFVALSALYVHKGSAESKDSDERVEASLRRIEEHLGTLPPYAREIDLDPSDLPPPTPEEAGVVQPARGHPA